MTASKVEEVLSSLSREDAAEVRTYMQKCAEAGVSSGVEEYVEKLEKVADEMDQAYLAGANLARNAVVMAMMRVEKEDVPDELVEKTASRYGTAESAHALATFALRALAVGAHTLEG